MNFLCPVCHQNLIVTKLRERTKAVDLVLYCPCCHYSDDASIPKEELTNEE